MENKLEVTKNYQSIVIIFFVSLFLWSCDQDDPVITDKIQLLSVRIGQTSLDSHQQTEVESANEIVLTFSTAIDPETVQSIQLTQKSTNTNRPLTISLADLNKQIVVKSSQVFPEGESFLLEISDELKGEGKEYFEGIEYDFIIRKDPLELINLSFDGQNLSTLNINSEIGLIPVFEAQFSHDFTAEVLSGKVLLNGDRTYELNIEKISDATFSIQPTEMLGDYQKHNLFFSSSIGDAVDRDFDYARYEIFTELDSTPDFPLLSDEDLLTLIQEQTFKYFWDFGHSNSGMARERNTSGNTVTSGGSGFGIMAMIVAVERGFITRDAALDRWEKILSFLETADRFHGVWPHWINGDTGKVRPFSQKDNGGDLVETAFLMQGLITVRQYLDPLNLREELVIDRINALWESVEWEWYTKGGEKVLYWHWSPDYNWEMNHRIQGHNETQIAYILAAASPTSTIDRQSYENGYARNGNMKNGNEYYSILLPLGFDKGGPLFFTHYSYLGLDPRNLSDQYANYWEQNSAHTGINRMHCIDNPGSFIAYSADCWGLTASDNHDGYSAHSPTNDLGVITPTAALSSLPYTPEESMDAIKHFYYILGDRLWGEYGFYDAFNFNEGWVADSYLAIDQGPIICMIENHRTALLWDLFMSAPEIQNGLDKLGFNY